MPNMPSSTDLRRQAARCLRIAAAVYDQKVAASLVAIADDFSAKADAIDPGLESTSLESTSLESTSLESNRKVQAGGSRR